jgi:hypothetical protein
LAQRGRLGLNRDQLDESRGIQVPTGELLVTLTDVVRLRAALGCECRGRRGARAEVERVDQEQIALGGAHTQLAHGETVRGCEAVRAAIDEHIEARRQDQAFRERLRSRHEEERELYKRLAS